jgi:hypothetical protein
MLQHKTFEFPVEGQEWGIEKNPTIIYCFQQCLLARISVELRNPL